jgi:hypothetical protein
LAVGPGSVTRLHVESLTVVEIFALLDELQADLHDNATRWFHARDAEGARTVLEERKLLHHGRHVLEEELRRRWYW